MNKEIVVKFDEKAYKEYEKLQKLSASGKHAKKKSTYSQLLNSINKAITNIKENPYYGNLIPKKYIPKGITNRYGTDKILRVSLVGYWRLLYTLVGDEIRIIAFVLEFMDHVKYNKIFGYRNK